MDKMDKYEEALQRAKELHDAGNFLTKQQIEIVFPELAESEDERIRKEIVGVIQKHYPNTPESYRWISWLVKQKESLHIPESCKENADSFTDDIIEVRSFQRGLEEGRRQEQEKQKEQKPEVNDPFDDEQFRRGYEAGKHDAMREQKPAGFYVTLNGEKYYAEEVQCNGMNVKVVAPKPAEWSKEDERKLQRCIEIVECWEGDYDIAYAPYSNFLKSLRPVKQEWNEEDERMLSRCVKSIESSKQFADTDTFKKAKDNEINWLKNRFKFLKPQSKAEWSEKLDIDTLREWSMRYAPDIRQAIESTAYHFYNLRPSWKPSEEQMNALENVIKCELSAGLHTRARILQTLQNDLKKL